MDTDSVASTNAPRERKPRRRARPGSGCALATVIVVVAFVLFGHGLFRRGVSVLTSRAAERIVECLPPNLDPKLRRSIKERLRSYVSRPVEHQSAGRFLELAGRVLDDDRVTRVEIEALDIFLDDELRERTK